MSVLEKLAHCVRDLLSDDHRIVVLGEDVQHGTMLGLTRHIIDHEDLAQRLLSGPLTSTSLLAHAGGLALGGQFPIVCLSGAQDLIEGLAGLREIGRFRWRSGDTRGCPLLCIVPVGPGFGLGGDADEPIENLLGGLRGIETLTVGRPDDAAAMLFSAVARAQATDGPVVLLIPRTVLLADAPATTTREPLSTVQVHRVGDQATVFCWGASVDSTLAAVDAAGVSSTVIELHSLFPLDFDALLGHAQLTGKLVIAHAGRRHAGVGAELAARFADDAILQLDAPVLRVSGANESLSARHEMTAIPEPAAIISAIQTVAQY